MGDDEDTFTREFEIESCNTKLTFVQKKVGDVNCVVWDAAMVLAKYLDLTNKNENWLLDKKVLELGAGLGCAGLTAACLGARVVLTDLENALPMLDKNIKINKMKWEKQGYAKCQVLEWGKEINLDFKPEVVLLADCIYYKESVEPLLQTLDLILTRSTNVYALLSQEQRDTTNQILVWKEFLFKLRSRFKVKEIPLSEQHPIYSSADIHLMAISNNKSV